jgi:hypothetical protein
LENALEFLLWGNGGGGCVLLVEEDDEEEDDEEKEEEEVRLMGVFPDDTLGSSCCDCLPIDG